LSIILALTSAAIFGVADFTGAVSSRRTGAFVTAVLSQAVGLVSLLAVVGFVPGSPDPRSIAWGAVAGLAGGLGLAVFFWAMAVGPIGVVSPLTAAMAAVVPLAVGIALGDWPEPVALVGIALGVAAVVLASGGGSRSPVAMAPKVLAATLGAGLGFGGFLVALAQTSSSAGLWPLVGARLASLAMFGLIAAAGHRSVRPDPGSWAPIAACGALDMLANIALLYAVQDGMLAISGVLASLGPLSTILLSRVVLGERLQRAQQFGVGLAVAAVSCVALA
jgi:drug/metabolite transporter (DMT)-like permease